MTTSHSSGVVAKHPRNGNTGVQTPTLPPKKGTSHCLDWFQYSVRWPDGIEVFPTMPATQRPILESVIPRHEALFLTGEVVDAYQGYTDAASLSAGRISWHRTRPEQKIGVMFTGRDLAYLREKELFDRALLTWAVGCADKIARMDFALDVYDPGCNPADLLQAYRDQQVTTRARKVVPITTLERSEKGQLTEANSVYFGWKTSETFVRVYDKAKEQQLDANWVRCELVVKNEAAMGLARDMVKHGIGVAGKNALKRHVNTQAVAWYQRALHSPDVTLTPKVKPDGDTIRWLTLSVAPVLERELRRTIAENDLTLYDLFTAILDRALHP